MNMYLHLQWNLSSYQKHTRQGLKLRKKRFLIIIKLLPNMVEKSNLLMLIWMMIMMRKKKLKRKVNLLKNKHIKKLLKPKKLLTKYKMINCKKKMIQRVAKYWNIKSNQNLKILRIYMHKQFFINNKNSKERQA